MIMCVFCSGEDEDNKLQSASPLLCRSLAPSNAPPHCLLPTPTPVPLPLLLVAPTSKRGPRSLAPKPLNPTPLRTLPPASSNP